VLHEVPLEHALPLDAVVVHRPRERELQGIRGIDEVLREALPIGAKASHRVRAELANQCLVEIVIPGCPALGRAFGLVCCEMTLLVLPAASARAGVVAADLGSCARRPLRGVIQIEPREGLVGQCEAHLEVVLVEVGLADRLELVRLEHSPVFCE